MTKIIKKEISNTSLSQGTLDFENSLPPHAALPGMSASEWVDFVYTLVGRPFKKEKHLPPSSTQVHLGLKN